MKYRVELERISASKRNVNPFKVSLASIDMAATIPVLVRVWEIEASSEKEVRAFYDEAVSSDLPNVRGFRLRSIAPIGESKND